MRGLRFLFAAPFLPLLAVACSGSGEGPAGPDADGPLSAQQLAVINGKLDSTHTSTMALLRQSGSCSGACSGTMVAVNGSAGYFLTAAHCVSPDTKDCPGDPGPTPAELVVVQGPDYNDNKTFVVHTVVDFKIHPSYNPQSLTYDFAMVKINSAKAGTPTSPILTKAEDKLAVGNTATWVGYGKTSNTDTTNSKRWYIAKTLASVDALRISHTSQGGGICQGDSGGPAFVVSGGVEKVAGVTSFGTSADCTNSQNFSGRVSAVEAFINGYITGSGGVDPQTCAQCEITALNGAGACSAPIAECDADTDCAAMLTCFDACAANDQTCVNKCASDHAAGAKIYQKRFDCLCQTGCAAECASDPICAPPSGCGFNFDDPMNPQCAPCIEAKCCSAGTDCAADAECTKCATTNPQPAGCDQNAKFNALATCYSKTCKTECGGAKCGFTAQNASCQTCFEGACCDSLNACAADTTCTGCLTGKTTGAACTGSDTYKAATSCIGTSCATECGGGSGGSGGAGGSGTAGKGGSAGTGTGGSAGTGTGGTGTGGTGTGGTGTGGTGTGGTGTAGSGTAGTGTAGSGTAGTGGSAGSATGGTTAAGGSTAAAGSSDATPAGETTDKSGCGCTTVGTSSQPGLGAAAFALGALLVGMRRGKKRDEDAALPAREHTVEAARALCPAASRRFVVRVDSPAGCDRTCANVPGSSPPRCHAGRARLPRCSTCPAEPWQSRACSSLIGWRPSGMPSLLIARRDDLVEDADPARRWSRRLLRRGASSPTCRVEASSEYGDSTDASDRGVVRAEGLRRRIELKRRPSRGTPPTNRIEASSEQRGSVDASN